ncbi:MAG: type II toxin-antitoxin system Phd/YefM family antitoxin [Chloroflexota bacterium]|nr:type II toxin-antitoxin system Phd/YefM family antitoxin [Chloroflexota bacterium]
MRTVSALDVRKKFGELLDEAAAGERLIIQRGGQPVAALVPLSDVAEHDPETIKKRRLAAIADIRRMARNDKRMTSDEIVELIRAGRRERLEHIMAATRTKK